MLIDGPTDANLLVNKIRDFCGNDRRVKERGMYLSHMGKLPDKITLRGSFRFRKKYIEAVKFVGRNDQDIVFQSATMIYSVATSKLAIFTFIARILYEIGRSTFDDEYSKLSTIAQFYGQLESADGQSITAIYDYVWGWFDV